MKKLLCIVVLLAAVFVAGCAEQASESDAMGAADVVEDNISVSYSVDNYSSINDGVVTGVPELKIMSVTVEDNMLTMKIKNTGNATATDVYAGIIGVDQYPNYTENELALFDGYGQTLVNILYDAIVFGSDYVDTGFALEYDSYKMESLKMSSDLISKDYLGDIAPGDMVVSSSNIYEVHGWYAKVVWMDGHEAEYVVY